MGVCGNVVFGAGYVVVRRGVDRLVDLEGRIMETTKSDSFAENLYRYLKEHPYSIISFWWNEDREAVVMEFYNSVSKPVRVNRFVPEFDIKNTISPDVPFSAVLLNGGELLDEVLGR